MKKTIDQLYKIAHKQKKMFIGLMSGTSLDGLDIALCAIEGNGLSTRLQLLQFETVSYEDDFRNEIKTVFAQQYTSLEKVCLLNVWIGTQHAAMINTCLQKWNISSDQIDIIASHGQTIFHAPKHQHKNEKFGNATLQIGDGDHIAVKTGIITISDFRQKHIAAGGEGAPLAAYGDFILFAQEKKDIILLNIGGIANFTFIPAGYQFDKIICSDIGPGNTMMDAFVQQQYPGKLFDNNAAIAKSGKCNEALLKALMNNDFINAPFPKTTGPELFNLALLDTALQKTNNIQLSPEDILATLNRFTAKTITDAIHNIPGLNKDNCQLLMSGGGIHNPLIVDYIKENTGITVTNTSFLGIHPDAKEAILFALLANECIAGDEVLFGEGKGLFPGISMGKISLPG